MKIRNTLLIVTITPLLLFSCASSYKTIEPETQEFSHKIETEKLTVEYNPEILKLTNNKKFQKRVDKRDIGFAFAKFSNKSDDTLNLSKDVIFKTQRGSSTILTKEEIYNKIKQRPWTYYLALLSAGFSFGSEGSSGFIGINALGLIYAIPNSIIASVANKKMRKEFEKYNFHTAIINPSESKFVLLNFVDEDKSGRLSIESIKGEKVNIQSVILPNNFDDYLKYDKEKHLNFQLYQEYLIKNLNESKLVIRVTVYERKYKNNQIKSIGTHAQHKLGENSSYLYKIGTWITYYKNGDIKEYIDYNIIGEKDGNYKLFKEGGELEIESKFEKGIQIK
jgi:hypothetical protein